ncbi:MAG: hypothetical protein VW683_13125 [Betaproteobacteria bacterium]
MITDEMIEAAYKVVKEEWTYFPTDKQEWTEALKAALEAAEAVRPSGWQPIEIAPKGERIMVYYKHFEGSVLSPYLVGIIFDNDGEIYLDCDNGEITIDELNSGEGLYWQPVPQPPKSEIYR